jgi:hypothetical protein
MAEVKNTKLVVILIGTLNVGAKDPAERVSLGIQVIAFLPHMKLKRLITPAC